jgi:hypothetical protein
MRSPHPTNNKLKREIDDASAVVAQTAATLFYTGGQSTRLAWVSSSMPPKREGGGGDLISSQWYNTLS